MLDQFDCSVLGCFQLRCGQLWLRRLRCWELLLLLLCLLRGLGLGLRL
jgi:hypothetical protein